MMEKIIATLAAIAAILFVGPLVGVFVGAFCGWVVGLLFTDTIIDFLSRIGVNTAGLAVWQIGASLGFLGTFFKSSVAHSTK